MSDSYSSKFLDDPEFQSLLVGCLESLERGETIDRDALNRDFPKYAAEIGQFLNDRDLLQRVASDFGDVSPSRLTVSAYTNTMDSASTNKGFSLGETVRYIGEYEILEEIARGGMGVVFKARQQKLGRTVALKMILAGRLADSNDVERFYREARAAGQLTHTNIVPVHEVGEHDGRHYFTMDYVEGCSLADTIRDETLAPRKAAELVESIAQAIQYAHEQGTVHRDLKPANVLLDSSGEPKVTDFGLAKMLGRGDDETLAELTATGQILGTPSYMSPEQASGDQESVGPASDIYSLGAILYACLTGRAPFVADSAVDTLLQVMNKEPVSPRVLSPTMPRDLETICLKCLNKEPHKRYGNAKELADDLNRFMDGRPVVARPIGRIDKSWRWVNRNPWIATLSTLSVLLLIVGTVVSTWFAIEAGNRADAEAHQRRRADQQATLARIAQQETEQSLKNEAAARADAERSRDAAAAAEKNALSALETEAAARLLAENAKHEAQWRTYVARLDPIRQAWLSGEYGHLDRLLTEVQPTVEDPDFRGWEWGFFKQQVQSLAPTLSDDHRFNGWMQYHANTGRLFAWLDNTTSLTVWDVEARKLIKTIDLPPAGQESLTISPDATLLAVPLFNQPKCLIWNIETNSPKRELLIATEGIRSGNYREENAQSTQWSPDGKQLLTATRDGEILLWNAADWSLDRMVQKPAHRSTMGGLDWHPSAGLATGHRFGWIRIWDTNTWKVTHTAKFRNQILNTLRWSPDGKTLGLGGTAIGFWKPESQDKTSALMLGDSKVNCLTWLDNDRIAFGGADQSVSVLAVDAESPESVFRIHSSDVRGVAMVDESTLLTAAANESARLLHLDNEISEGFVTIEAHRNIITEVSFSPDGSQLATAAMDDAVRLWDTQTHRKRIELNGFRHNIPWDVDWKHDGTELATVDHLGHVARWDAASGEQIMERQVPKYDHPRLDWRPSKETIVVGGTVPTTLDAETLEIRWQGEPGSPPAGWRTKLQFAPDGETVAGISEFGQVAFARPSEDRILATRWTDDRGNGASAWSPDGKWFLAAGSDLHVYDAQNHQLVRRLEGHRGRIGDVCFHPSGSRIASAGFDGDIIIWDAVSGDLLVRIPTPNQSRLMAIDWSPDGSRLAVGDKDGRLHILSADFETDETQLNNSPSLSQPDPKIRLAELTIAIAENPLSVEPLKERGLWYAGHDQWDKALADFRKIVELQPFSGWHPCVVATAALHVGAMDDFRSHLNRNLDKLPDWDISNELATAAWVAELATLDPDQRDIESLRPLAERRGDWNPENRGQVRTVALLELRAGNAQRVLDLTQPVLEQSMPEVERSNLQLLRALALLKLNRQSEAVKLLREAETLWQPGEPQKDPKALALQSMRSVVINRVLRNEVRDFIGE